MITEERLTTFINSLDSGNTPFLEELEKQAKKDCVPIIRREVQSFLKVLMAIKKPSRILEIGTAVGFSALLMAAYTDPECRITTIEDYEKRIPIARRNFERAGMADRIRLLEGDAAEVMKTLADPFDFVFMDAAKGQYIRFLPEVLRLMKPGSLLLADNVLQDGDLIESHFLVERRNRTIYKRMREYLYEVKHNRLLVTSIIPMGDGLALSVRQDTGGEKDVCTE